MAARYLGDGRSVVVTTTAVFLDEDGGARTRLDTFTGRTQLAALAVSSDGSSLALATSVPSRLRWYDLAGSTVLGTAELPPELVVTSIDHVPARNSMVVETTAGVLEWTDPLTAPQSVVDVENPGRAALDDDGRIVVPVMETTDLVVADPGPGEGGATMVALEAPAGVTLTDARTAPGTGVLAVATTSSPDGFEHHDGIVLLDAAHHRTGSEIDVGGELPYWSWAMSDTAVATTDGADVSVWSFDGTPMTTLDVPDPQRLSALMAIADGGFAAVLADGRVALWNAPAWTRTVIPSTGAGVIDASTGPEGRSVVVVDRRGGISRWNSVDGSLEATIDRYAVGEATDVAVSADGAHIATSSSIGRVDTFDASLAGLWSFDAGGKPVDTVAYSPATGDLATGLAAKVSELAFDDTVALWDPVDESQVFEVDGSAEDVAGCSFFLSRIQFTSDGTRMFASSHDFTVGVFDTATGGLLASLPAESSGLLDVGLTPDDRLLVTTADNASVRVYDATDYSMIAEYRSPAGGFLAIAMMPDSTTMAIADVTGAIWLVDIRTGAPIRQLVDTDVRTSNIALSPDGALLAAPMADGAVGIWSTGSGQRLATIEGHTAMVSGLAFAPDGRWLATSSEDGTVRTWTLSMVEEG